MQLLCVTAYYDTLRFVVGVLLLVLIRRFLDKFKFTLYVIYSRASICTSLIAHQVRNNATASIVIIALISCMRAQYVRTIVYVRMRSKALHQTDACRISE
jgi:hypothetical protein